MGSKSIPSDFGQGWPRENLLSKADIALRSSGSPHSPNGIREHVVSFPSSVGAMGGISAPVNKHGNDYKSNLDDEFKKHVVAMLMQRESDMHFFVQELEQIQLKLEAVSIDLVNTKAMLYEERKTREGIINVIVTKEKIDNEERERKEAEELKKKREQAWREKEEWKRMYETIAVLKQGQKTLGDHMERIYKEDHSIRLTDIHKTELLTPREIMENMRKDEEEIKDECGKIREEQKMANVDSPSNGPQSPTIRVNTPSIKGSGLVITCFNCNQEGHYARDCLYQDMECELRGGMGHSTINCFNSKRCYNCNKAGHRYYECKAQGSRRCFHCRKVGHLAINCKYGPNSEKMVIK